MLQFEGAILFAIRVVIELEDKNRSSISGKMNIILQTLDGMGEGLWKCDRADCRKECTEKTPNALFLCVPKMESAFWWISLGREFSIRFIASMRRSLRRRGAQSILKPLLHYPAASFCS
ncbi:hypothetical protein CEXT_453991 [Caerostris extrusa]|uniref:Uncharacterized protein n=1 Tax=Caerostris extrusa TaxID=172846 RepID=A0AAV4SAH9_CAEEX|nr:hypothetical protein CEXT_453991 [Caerostris extrusa]